MTPQQSPLLQLDDVLPVDPSSVDWNSTTRVTYLVQQWFRYDYSGPVQELRQRLVVCPRSSHGSQKLLRHRLQVGAESTARTVRWRDDFGNTHIEVSIPQVHRTVSFTAWSVIQRGIGAAQRRPSITGFTPRLLRPTPLTRPDGALRKLARELRHSGFSGAQLAALACETVHQSMTYTKNATSVRTTASEAFAMHAGVCQDYAHVALTVLRLLGFPARYVSGHLLGEGGTHAWVEVAVPDGSHATVLALDPTHGCDTGPTYLTVAVGRDYRDVAPLSGSYRTAQHNTLQASKRVVLLDAA